MSASGASAPETSTAAQPSSTLVAHQPSRQPSTTPSGAGVTTSTAAVTPVQAAASRPEVDVEAVLSQMQASHNEQLNWRTSIVDLLKLLGLDSSLNARKQLARELHYDGSTEDSAAMNIWLHKQVMQKLAENGGKVPGDLKD